MADVEITPKIQCDNCGDVRNKQQQGTGPSRSFHKPSNWGSCRIEGGKAAAAYGEKEKIGMPDLCEACANAVIDAAGKALSGRRSETKS